MDAQYEAPKAASGLVVNSIPQSAIQRIEALPVLSRPTAGPTFVTRTTAGG
jgi:hypothetical protein